MKIKKDPSLAKLIDASPVDIQFGEQQGTDLSGKIIFGRSSDMEQDLDHYDEDSFSFYCGPEEEKGYLHDAFDCYEEMELIFEDLPSIEIGAAENFHKIPVKPDTDVRKLWDAIKRRLRRCGAVESHDLI